ncbi:MAG: iron-siderophore ABC transporter substrate-binding protein [Rhodococcus sp. (in: high G+C Gram-positive bacteria)]
MGLRVLFLPKVVRLAAAAAAGLLVLASVSCGSDESPGDAHASTSGSFPITIEHEFGATTITEKPERVVTLGVTDADAVIALGTIPVGNTGFVFYENGLGPWTEDEVGDADLTRIASDSQPNLEQIAELAPDLILGISAGFDEAVYDKLDAIAPTVARPAGTAAYTVDRAVATETIATALGEAERGMELNRQTQELLESTRANHPEFAERTGVVVLASDVQYSAFLPGDARGQFLTSLGFSVPEAITEHDTGDSFYVPVSAENVAMLDADAILYLSDDEDVDVVAENPLFGTLEAGRKDAIVTTSLDERGAISYNSVLSIPYAIDSVVPRLAGS